MASREGVSTITTIIWLKALLFYLAHANKQKTLLVYRNQMTAVEWKTTC